MRYSVTNLHDNTVIMSQDPALSRTKEKKAQRDAERKSHKDKKRKLQHSVQEPGDAEELAVQKLDNKQSTLVANPGSLSLAEKSVVNETKKSSSSKKRKQSDVQEEDGPAGETPQAAPPQQKKRRQSKPASAPSTSQAANAEEPTKPAASTTKSRFILFVGNLPYSTTDTALNLHFAKLHPFTLRHRTDPKTKKSKGFAFLEFENYDRMKTCLSQFHHSLFDPESPELGGKGKGNGRGGRKINVELTAGGGGKTEGRKEKIRVKNERLEGQRERRAEAERKEKARKERKENGKVKKDGEVDDEADDVGQESGIHPSRLARINE